MRYIWKINMIDGSHFLVYSKEKDASKFTEQLLPRVAGGDTINLFDCVKSNKIDGISCNSVAIIGSKVVSVEYKE